MWEDKEVGEPLQIEHSHNDEDARSRHILTPVETRLSILNSEMSNATNRRVSSPRMLKHVDDDEDSSPKHDDEQTDDTFDYEQPVRVRYTALRKLAAKRYTLFLDQRFPSDEQEEEFLNYYYGTPNMTRIKVLAIIALVYLLLRLIQHLIGATAPTASRYQLGLTIYRAVFYLLVLFITLPVFTGSFYARHKVLLEFFIFVCMCLNTIASTTQLVLYYGSTPGAIPVTFAKLFVFAVIRIRTYYSYMLIPLVIVNFLVIYLALGYTPGEMVYLRLPAIDAPFYDWLQYNQAVIRCVLYVLLLTVVVIFQYVYSYYLEKFHRNQFLAKRALKQDARLLRRERQRSALLFRNIIPQYFIEKVLLDGRLNRVELFRNGSVLMSDVLSFRKILNKRAMTTSSSTRSLLTVPMEASEILNALNFHFTYFDILSKRLHLQRVKIVGDRYICMGGLRPKKDEEEDNTDQDQYDNHVERIVEMGLRMVGAAKILNKRYNWQLETRIGIAMGQVCAAVLGKSRLTFDCFGRAVRLAELMQKNSLPASVRCTERVVKTCVQTTDKFKFFPQKVIVDTNVGRIHSSFVTSSKALLINASDDLHLFEGKEDMADETVLPNAIIDEEVILEEHRIRDENRAPRKQSEDLEIDEVLARGSTNPDEVVVDDDDDDEAREIDLDSVSGSRKRSNDRSDTVRRNNIAMSNKDAPVDISLPEEDEGEKPISMNHASKSFISLRALQSQESIRLATMKSYEQEARESDNSPISPSEKPHVSPVMIDNLSTRSVFVLMMVEPRLALQYIRETYPSKISFIRSLLIVLLLFHLLLAALQAALFPNRYGFQGAFVAPTNSTAPPSVAISNSSNYTPVITIYVAIAIHIVLLVCSFLPTCRYLLSYVITIIILFLTNMWVCISFVFDTSLGVEVYLMYISIWSLMIIGLFPLIPVVIRCLMYIAAIVVYFACYPNTMLYSAQSIPAVLIFLLELAIFLIANSCDDMANISYWRVKSQVEAENSRVDLERQWNDSLLYSVLPEKLNKQFTALDQIIDSESPTTVPSKDNLLLTQITNGCVCFVQVAGVNDMILANQNIHLSLRLLVDMFDSFDTIILEKKGENEVDKVKSIGDMYICSSGIYGNDSLECLKSMINVAFRFKQAASKVLARQRYVSLQGKASKIGLRIGISLGDYAGCVLGQQFFQFDIFGDTVVSARRMCLTALNNTVHVSEKLGSELVRHDLAREKHVDIGLENEIRIESPDLGAVRYTIEAHRKNDKLVGYWLTSNGNG